MGVNKLIATNLAAIAIFENERRKELLNIFCSFKELNY